MSPLDIHKPVPLSQWVTGILTLHFAGATVERRMSLAEAHSIHDMIDDKRSSDRLTWSALNWIQFASEKVLVCDFTADEDLGYELTSNDRNTLTRHGHPHGILRTLVDYWKDKDREPSYSVLAVVQLTHFVLEGTTGDEFTGFVERLEGQAGSDVIQAAIARVDAEASQSTDRSTTSATPPDGSEPDEPETIDDESNPPGEDTTNPEAKNQHPPAELDE